MEQDLKRLHTMIDNLSSDSKMYFASILCEIERLISLNPDVNYLKLLSSNLVEYADAIRVFKQDKNVPKVCIFGSARTKNYHPLYEMTESLSKQLSEQGYRVITGAGPGIMEAGNKGAGHRSFGLNILLPFEQEANKYIKDSSKLVSFKYFFLRKLIFVKESKATILFPGGFGTFDEAFELLTLLQTGRTSPQPLILIDEPKSTYWSSWMKLIKCELLNRSYIAEDDLCLINHFTCINDSIHYINEFYSVYSSIKYFEDTTLIYTKKPLSEALCKKINLTFSHLLVSGNFVFHLSIPKAYATSDCDARHALEFNFDCKQFSGLVKLIELVNTF